MKKELKKFCQITQLIVAFFILSTTNNSFAVPVNPDQNNQAPINSNPSPPQTARSLKQSNKNTATPQAFSNPDQQQQNGQQALALPMNSKQQNNNTSNNIINIQAAKESAKKKDEQEAKSWDEVIQKKSEKASFVDELMSINYSDKNPPKLLYTRTQNNENYHLPPVYFKSYYLSLAFKAAELNDINSLNAILSKYNFLNGQNKEGDTLLMHAIQYSSLDVARSLIAKGALVDAINNRKRTALHYAATIGDHETAKLLLSMGADFTLLDDKEMTALDYAKASNNNHVAIIISQYYKYNSIVK